MNAPGVTGQVTLFTQEGCPDSARMRTCVRRSAVPFVERHVTGDLAAARDLLATGIFATPVIQTGTQVVVGARLDHLAETLGFQCRCPDASDRQE